MFFLITEAAWFQEFMCVSMISEATGHRLWIKKKTVMGGWCRERLCWSWVLLHTIPAPAAAAAHPFTNDSCLGSVVPNNKIARVAVKWILSLFTSLQLAPCIIYLMAFALFSRRFSSFITSGDNSELHVRWEDVTLIQSWWLKLMITFFFFFLQSANLWWMKALANINHRSSAHIANVNDNQIIPVKSLNKFMLHLDSIFQEQCWQSLQRELVLIDKASQT